jgi:hypothetical protein
MADPKKKAEDAKKKEPDNFMGKVGTGLGISAAGGLTAAMINDAKNRGLGRNILNDKFNDSLTSQVKAKPTSITSSRIKPTTDVKPPVVVKPQQVGPTPASGINPKSSPSNTAPKTSPVPSSGQRFNPAADRVNYPKSIISNASFDNTAIDAANNRKIALSGRDLSGNRVPLSSPVRATAKTATTAQDRAQLPELESKARSKVAARQRAVISSVQRRIQPMNTTLQSLGVNGIKLNIPTSQIKEQTDKVMQQASQRTEASDKPLSPRQTERAAANLSKEAGLVPKSKFGKFVSNTKDVGRAIGGIKLGDSKLNIGKMSKRGGLILTTGGIALGAAMPKINEVIGRVGNKIFDSKNETPAGTATPDTEKPADPVAESSFNKAMNETIRSANKNAPQTGVTKDYHQWIVDRMRTDYGEAYSKKAEEYLKKQGKK